MKPKFTSIFYRLLWSYSAIFLLLFTAIFSVLFIKISTNQVHCTISKLHQEILNDRHQLELELFQTLTNVKAWSTLSVMDNLLTDDADQQLMRRLETLKQQYQLKGHVYALSNKGVLVAADHPIAKKLECKRLVHTNSTNEPFINKHVSPADGSSIIAFWQPV